MQQVVDARLRRPQQLLAGSDMEPSLASHIGRASSGNLSFERPATTDEKRGLFGGKVCRMKLQHLLEIAGPVARRPVLTSAELECLASRTSSLGPAFRGKIFRLSTTPAMEIDF